MWWKSVKDMGWKRNAINDWAYDIGAAVFNAQVREANKFREEIKGEQDSEQSKKNC